MLISGRLIVVTTTLLVGCSGVSHRPSACDDLVEKTVGITRDDYSACAGEMLAALDSLRPQLGRFVTTGDREARAQAEAHLGRLRFLMRQVGFTPDVWREAREGAGRTIQRWPDGSMRSFNGEVVTAAAQYGSALGYRNQGNFEVGQRHHAMARRAYARFR